MIKRKVFWLIFVTSVIWGSKLPGVTIPYIGTLFPLRIITFSFPFFVLLKSKIPSSLILKKACFSFGIMLLSGILTLFWTINISSALTSLIVYMTSFLIVIICIYFTRNKEDILYITKAYTLNIILIGIIGIYESFTGNYIFNFTIYDHYTRTYNLIGLYRPLVQFYNINDLAAFMVLSVPICFIAFEYSKSRLIKRITIFLLCVLVGFLSASRAAILGICILIILIVFKKLRLKNFVLHIIVFLIVNLLMLSFILLYFEEIMLFIIKEGRFLIWFNTLLVSSDYYFMGVGPGNSYYANFYNQHMPVSVYAVHNYLLELFCEFGIIGAGIFYLWIANLILENRRNMKFATANYRYMLNMSLVFIVLFVVLNIGPSSMSGMYFVWLNFGVSAAIINLVKTMVVCSEISIGVPGD